MHPHTFSEGPRLRKINPPRIERIERMEHATKRQDYVTVSDRTRTTSTALQGLRSATALHCGRRSLNLEPHSTLADLEPKYITGSKLPLGGCTAMILRGACSGMLGERGLGFAVHFPSRCVAKINPPHRDRDRDRDRDRVFFTDD